MINVDLAPNLSKRKVTNSSYVNLLKENQYNRIGREQRKSSRYEYTSKTTTVGLNNSEEKILLLRTELENLKTRLDKL